MFVSGTDSEESEFSSLERDKTKDLYSKVNRKPTPHKKKHKQKGTEGQFVTQINIDRHHSDQERLHDLQHGARGKLWVCALRKFSSNLTSHGVRGKCWDRRWKFVIILTSNGVIGKCLVWAS